MQSTIDWQERSRGALLGAAIGAEFGWLRWHDDLVSQQEKRFAVKTFEEALAVKLEPIPDTQPVGRITFAQATPLVALGVRAFLKRQGRLRPEDLAPEFMRDR